MLSLSFKDGLPVAQIINKEEKKKSSLFKKNDGRFIYVQDSSDFNSDDSKDEDPILLLGEDFFRKKRIDGKKINLDQLVELHECLQKRTVPEYEDLIPIYEDAIKAFNDKRKKEIKLEAGNLIPIPNPKSRQVIYCAGPSGSGKSTWMSIYASQWKKMFPNNPIYLFSAVKEDPAFSTLKPTVIPIDEELFKMSLETTDFQNALVIFDDIDVISNKAIQQKVLQIREQILEIGRHSNTYTLCSAHQMMNYKQTRTLLNESSCVTLFPNSGSQYHVKRFFKEYCGMDRTQVANVFKLGSRWVTVHRTHPNYILYDRGIYLLN